jgi:PAS domain S-box-containing protein
VNHQSDYIIFCSVALAIYFAVHLWVWRRRDGGKMPLVSMVFVCFLLTGGWFWVESARLGEMEGLRTMVEGYAPTYAQEIERMGHSEITPETSADDPKYLAMIEAEKRWLAVNPRINDIYTMRRLPDGKVVIVVDSETDYDRNGRFEGPRENRTEIGEQYEQTEPALEAALDGKPGFTTEMITDRWGTWVSAFVPLHAPDGSIDGILGIDYDANTWKAAIDAERLKVMSILALVILCVMSANGASAHVLGEREFEENRREQERLRLSKLKFETLVNSIDGIVWECDAHTFHFSFVSQQSVRILGYTPEQWTCEPDFWRSKLHPEDAWAYEHARTMVSRKEPYQFDYRMIAADDRTVWIRESAATLVDKNGDPMLVRGVFRDITEQKRAAEELNILNRQLVESSRRAGMAEVATGVLHNVGNVLNSVNVSSTLINDRIRSSKIADLLRVAALLRQHATHLPEFLGNDPSGRLVPELIHRLIEALQEEHRAVSQESDLVLKNVGHIRDIVSMQQNFATVSGVSENLTVETLVEDAIGINAASLARHDIIIERDYADVPEVFVDRHKVLQILVNLIRNAEQALDEAAPQEKHLKLKVRATGSNTVTVAVVDNGVGIPQENLSRIFSHGFTTKKSGHGFGLHSGALAAKEMRGSLQVHSDGVGMGAIFTLELPLSKPGTVAVPPAIAEVNAK